MSFPSRPRPTPARTRRTAVFLAAVLMTASCGGDDGASGGDASVRVDRLGEARETSLPENAEPTRGGQLVYGLEAESSDYCLPSAQLAISGMQVVRAIYDPLVLPDSEGRYQPYLAKSIEPSADYKTWTITLKPGVVFHDGSPLTATVVKNNLDAYRGRYPNRSSTLFAFALDNIESVTTVDEMTVRVTTVVPWVAFPASLYSSGRLGILSQSQLDAPVSACETEPVGTGPFRFVSWDRGESLKVVRNEQYWQKAPDGKPYPYLNAIDFQPVASSDERLAALVKGDLNMIHTSAVSDLAENIPNLEDDGVVNALVSDDFTETAYLMLNVSGPPFDRREARIAFAQAMDRERVNDEANKGFATLADGPFAPGVMGFVEEPGRPAYDPEAARKAVEALKAEGVDMSIRILSTIDPSVIRSTLLAVEMLREVGFEVELETELQEDLIDRVLAGDFQSAAFRNQPGDDPDMNYVWWYGAGNPVNFARFDDPVINEALDKGRSEPDPEKRRSYYETIHKRMATEVYYSYQWYVPWAVVEARNVHGILGPQLPSGDDPSTRLANGHAVHGIWIDA
ncbi:MAG TPA: ABC transporter substrate-binding protein [Acidimicrobiales bacterium]|jgi:peptide/nickel transport system substrate-binding protein|nr:ABC transporter substrate-binding protein [Acidimicrobiales bacterium]